MQPSGIGGWLLLPALGLIATPIYISLTLFRDVMPVFAPEVWTALTQHGSDVYHPMWAPVLIFEIGANSCLLVLTLWLGYLFFRKSKRTPSVFISWLAISLAVQLIDLLLLLNLPPLAQEAIPSMVGSIDRAAISAAIWIPYFLRSERVRNTFAFSAIK